MKRKHDTLSIDEKLAQFTDQLLEDEIIDISESDAELKALVGTVRKLHAAFDEEIGVNKAEEIRKNVLANWLNIPKLTKKTQSTRKKRFSWTDQRRYSMVASLAIILIFIVLTPVLLTNNPALAGSAGILSQKTSLFITLGLFLAVVLIWALRKKQ